MDGFILLENICCHLRIYSTTKVAAKYLREKTVQPIKIFNIHKQRAKTPSQDFIKILKRVLVGYHFRFLLRMFRLYSALLMVNKNACCAFQVSLLFKRSKLTKIYSAFFRSRVALIVEGKNQPQIKYFRLKSKKTKMNMKKLFLIIAFALLIPAAAAAQGTGFNFQGRLNDGANPANGSYDLQFRLFNAITGGTQIGSLAARPNTALINGVFSVTLDFGAAAFNNPNAVFIEIGVKPAGSPNAFTILGPRQQLTVVPFAVRANTATSADNATNAQNAVNATNATTATNALSLGNVSASSYPRLNVVNDGEFRLNGGFYLDGDIRQLSTAGGAVKAMALVRVTRPVFPNPNPPTALIVRCFSGIALPSAPNCGITIGTIGPSDTVQVNFGFPVNNRFISLTGFNDTVSLRSYPNATTLEIDDTTTNGGSSEFFIYIF